MAVAGQMPTHDVLGPKVCETMQRCGLGLYLEGSVSGQSCEFLVDTGAQVSIFSRSVWQCIEPRGKLTPYKGSARAANGSTLGVLGIWSTFCDVHHLTLACNFLVVDSLYQEAILGTDFLRLLLMLPIAV